MNNKKRFVLFLEFINKNKKMIGLILIAFTLFYWFAWRPTIIKKECSWTTYETEPIPAFAGITQEQAKEMTKECLHTGMSFENFNKAYNKYFISDDCPEVKPESPRPAVPSKKITRTSTENEYKMCLRHHGL